ncbi:hypothetical protein SAMN02745857_00132 [Andreprevotia lacus DSM 23236]|jgi:pimeloyl-ACP methyl ester carboxylesterase|uniref:AB hydrolase-1 domain-containing protein n=1 Tax=Andreprevotia lacus DSM 23236 TaxID=1121001 RepID=A0A1W1WWX0_9NEIS|nr:alpha/beta fold hydrolase [Andreprevotia lacus]SMC16222.1 hypothetical protein SAMN02745857_00132 [Andreprevotia lacus DSM 23236]
MHALLKVTLKLARLVLLAWLIVCAALYLWQRKLLYFPAPALLANASNTLMLDVGDARLQLSTRPASGPGAVLYFGGNAEDASQTLPLLAAAFPDQAIYLQHYRGYGGSTGEPSEAALVGDALKTFDWLHTRHASITVIGRSLGSGVAVQLAAQRPVTRLVLVTPYDSVQNVAQQQFPWLPVSWLLQDKYESWRYASRISAPVSVLLASDDQVIARGRSLALIAAFGRQSVRVHTLAHTDHNSISDAADYAQLLALP